MIELATGPPSVDWVNDNSLTQSRAMGLGEEIGGDLAAAELAGGGVRAEDLARPEDAQ
jgi:hypothetical protein